MVVIYRSSVSIEAQFYLLLPFVLIIFRNFFKGNIIIFTIIIIILSLTYSIFKEYNIRFNIGSAKVLIKNDFKKKGMYKKVKTSAIYYKFLKNA